MDADQARTTLTEERAQLTEVAQRNRAEAPQPGADDEGGMGQHAADMGTEVETQMEDRGMAEEAERRVTDIDAALVRIQEGTWGRCVVDGGDIEAERLDALPEAARCMKHQEEYERVGG